MPTKYTIDQVIPTQVGKTEYWDIYFRKPDSNSHIYRMPKITLDARAAEYGIDATDVETLMEISLHEIFLEMSQDDETNEMRFDDQSPTLMSAESTQAAREAHINRLKTCPVKIDTRGNKALDVIRSSHQPNPAWIQSHKESVDIIRWVKKHGNLPQLPSDPQPKSAAGKMARALGITVTIPDLSRE
jgi:hypothetical protein